MSKAIGILLKALSLLPLIVEIVADIEAAKAEDSAGGKKVTAGEVAKIIADGVVKFGKALAGLFGTPS